MAESAVLRSISTLSTYASLIHYAMEKTSSDFHHAILYRKPAPGSWGLSFCYSESSQTSGRFALFFCAYITRAGGLHHSSASTRFIVLLLSLRSDSLLTKNDIPVCIRLLHGDFIPFREARWRCRAKRRGWERLSPFETKNGLSLFFFGSLKRKERYPGFHPVIITPEPRTLQRPDGDAGSRGEVEPV